ncbi:non-ribosomal peptide synthetase [Alkaliphilus transvaalensis]|uniref:non-ribosomal peptide synthetase n=1 Tax=Alkaliphilus transvaalensis TaxID=114628 RepID=UPI00047D042C|nr:non-ribosomal peptide synthetase [Alkaliphilus transvaalensis]
MDKLNYVILSSKKFILQKEYWMNKLSHIEDVDSLLEYDYSECNDNKEIQGIDFVLEKDLTSRIEDISKNSHLNILAILASLLACTIYKYKGTPDICIPMPVYRESENDSASQEYNKEILLNYQLSDSMTFKDLLIHGKNLIMEAYKHQDYPLEKILDELEEEKQKCYRTFLEGIFIYKNLHQSKDLDITNKNLAISCCKEDGVVKLEILYNKNLFDINRIKQLAKHYKKLITELLSNPNESIGGIEILEDDDKQQLLRTFNNTHFDYGKDEAISKIFEKKAEATPNKIAIIQESEKITYKELNYKANQLARFILKNEKRENATIAIMTEPSIATIIALLGVLKAGCRCLTIDYAFPSERIKYLMADSEVNLVLTQGHIKGRIYNNLNGSEQEWEHLRFIDIYDEKIYEEDYHNLEGHIREDSVAYVIYTSGSTGKPKGAMLTHKGIVNVLNNLERLYPMLEEDVYLFKTTYTFDVSLTELFGWFIGKGTLAILNDGDNKDPKKILDAIFKYKVTHLAFVPTMFEAFVTELVENNLKSLKQLKYLFIGGEVLSTELVKKFYSLIEGVEVMNYYGPTETTIYATSFPVAPKENSFRLPVGKPMDNMQVYILNHKGELQPVGISGEVYIGGKGVSCGYVNNQLLTQERYIDNPFIKGEKMYKTGDIARWRWDGNIDYIGRVDHQIKLRGLRIELGEIENVIKNFHGITQSKVLVKEDENKGQYLCGYVVADNEVDIKDLKEFLYNKLPLYMVPAYIIQLDEFRYTTSGKISILNLPDPIAKAIATNDYIAPRNEEEEVVLKIWQEVLGDANIGVEDNFFDLGGNSVNAIEILSKIFTKFNTEITIGKFFELKNISGVCQYINNKEKSLYASMKAIEEQPYYPASSSQKRLYALNAINKENINYNMPEILVINGEIDRREIEKIFNLIVNRHEAFRTRFEFREHNLVQLIEKNIDFTVDFMDFDEAYMEKIISSFIRPFDLSKEPLLRALLVRVDPLKHYLLIDMHHIISDGTSMGIIIDEFIKVYKNQELKDLSIQYKEFSNWQMEFMKSENFIKQEKFWLEMFSGEIPVLELPTDFPRGKERLYEGATLTFELNPELSSKIKAFAAKNSVTPFIFLLTTYYLLLNKYSQQEDIIVAYPIVGRPLPELNDVVGMFVNTIAMRNYIDNEKSFISFLDETKNKALQIYENQDYPFDTLVDKLNVKRNSNRNVLFDTMFSLRDTYFSQIDLGDCTLSKYVFETKQTKFDLYYNVEDYPDKILLEATYRSDLFKEETMKRFNKHFENLIKAVVEDPYAKISDIELISHDERQEVLHGLNVTHHNTFEVDNVVEQFENQVKKNPEAIALEFGDEKLTYGQLNEKANQIARKIVEKNTSKGRVIAIICKRSFEMIIAIMASLKAGCAYLPIDVDYPVDRVKYLVEDSNSKLILSNLDLRDKEIDPTIEVLRLDDEATYKGSTSNLGLKINGDDLAYIIYTSGTTGKPNGVLISHYNLIARTINANYCNINEDDRVLQLSNYTFDGSVFDIYLSLLNGVRLIIIPQSTLLDMEKLAEVIENSNVSVVLFPTALFNIVVDTNVQCLKNIRKIVIGGERLKIQYVKKAFEVTGPGSIVNIYGPTECTICATYYTVNSLEEVVNDIPIGKPLSNTKVYICDKYNKVQPIGLPGEICILGDGVGKGYLNAPQLNSRKFVANPFEETGLMYKTGDIGKMLPDGNIVFIDRMDDQVKLRGFRIELGEIESTILSNKSIKECIVLLNKDMKENQYLCAYLVREEAIDTNELRDYLKDMLPKFMIPSDFIFLEKMPITPNGKVDKRVLRSMNNVNDNQTEEEMDYKDLDFIERQIIDIWRDVLGTSVVRVEDNFFECGGNSLLAVKVEVEMKKVGLNVKVEDIYNYQTINELSQYIKGLEG